jgi:predicted methyltransferase MtxX (methanogen marker protein 4)
MMAIPIIRLEVEGIKHTVEVALSEYSASMDADIQLAIADALTPEHVLSVVSSEVQKHMDAAIRTAVESFFRYNGSGAEFIKNAVHARLEQQLKNSA